MHLGRVLPNAGLESRRVGAVGAEVGRDFHVAHQMAQQGLPELELLSAFGALVVAGGEAGNQGTRLGIVPRKNVVELLAMDQGTGSSV